MGSGTPSLHALEREAKALGRRAQFPKAVAALPHLWLFTDPDRTSDPAAAITALPPGCGVVLRTFGRAELEAQAPALATLARSRGLVVLVGADADLAQGAGAQGVHLPQRLAHTLPGLRARFPQWTLTVAAHDAAALRRAEKLGADAAFLSPVFPSSSPSAGQPLGPTRASALVRSARLPVYALGGVDARTITRLRGTGVSGVAGVGFASPEEAGQSSDR